MRIGPYVVYRDYSFGSPEMTVFDLYKHDWQFTGYYNGDVACDDGDACGGTRTWNYFGVYHENLPDVGLDELAKCIEEEVAAADPNFPLALVAGLKACVDELG